ncbi:protein raptor homolog [Topomyia yanbarensis]|uniref:protein raptor homolog n=1 Tax=Topomyia yanbarensis TaxID=2498891 RepID=UPI00273B9190|nr:protein raptor homolog [Topomyia yanbarensis]
MEDFQTTTSVQLSTTVILPDVVSWKLTERTYSWISIIWLQEQSCPRLVKRKSQLLQPVASLQRTHSNYAQINFRNLPDPVVADLRNACLLLTEKESVNARPVIHYNGHSLGDYRQPEVVRFWLNDDYYCGNVELSVQEVQQWLGMPAIFVYDCDSAGRFLEGVKSDDKNFHLAGCMTDENLPDRKDLFSCVLSSPVKAAFDWHCEQFFATEKLPAKLPGDLCDRQTLVGQLDWILTLLTDAVAYNLLPADRFRQLFRKDVLAGALWRRFILAQRILKKFGCTPVSEPVLPDCSESDLWKLWDKTVDLAVELLLTQDERECSLIDEFFGCVLKQSDREYLFLIAQALAFSEQCLFALDTFQRCWQTSIKDSHIQEYILKQVVILLRSEDEKIFYKTVSVLVNVFKQDITLARHLQSIAEANLCEKLKPESEDVTVLRVLSLQLLIEQNSHDRNVKETLLTNCVSLFNHKTPEVRMLSALIVSTLANVISAEHRAMIKNLLCDSSPKVRTAALEAWISLNSDPKQSDELVSKILSLIQTNFSLMVRNELIRELSAIVVQRVPELVAASKQHPNSKQLEQIKSSKAKAKSKSKNAAHQNKSASSAVMVNMWCTMNALVTDSDSTMAGTMQSLVSFVKQKAVETEIETT